MSKVVAKTVSVQNSAGTLEATLSFDGVNVVSDKPVVQPAVPMFSAYKTDTQSLPASTNTKVTFNVTEFNVTGGYNTSTSRFTPQKAGYYLVTSTLQILATSTLAVMVLKNGAVYKSGGYSAQTTNTQATLTCLVYCNGTTDYLEISAMPGVAGNLNNSRTNVYFQAAYIGA